MRVSEKVTNTLSQARKQEQLTEGEGLKNLNPMLYNQRDVVRKINFYINDKYTERDDDALFWNISNSRISHFVKLINPDTKDFYPYGIGEHNFTQAWALRRKVEQWFNDESFYKTLNDIAEGLATYGSIVWKKYTENGKTKIKEVKLDNIYFDQKSETINDSDAIVELHYLTPGQIQDKKEVWNNTDKLPDKDEVEVWEFTGYMNGEFRRIIGHGYGSKEVILWEDDEPKSPYIDFHLGRFRGRWLRIGVVERLFPLQERANQLVNQNAQATEIASLLLLKSNSPDATGNVLEQAVNGQIIGDESLQQLGITNTGLNQFIQELQVIDQQADKLCLTPEVVRGEGTPSNTTFRGIAVMHSGAVNAFKRFKQDLFEKIADFLLQEIFPTLVKSWNQEHIMEIAEDDQDIEKYNEALLKTMKRRAVLSGELLTPEKEQKMREKIEKSSKKKKIKLPENFFNFKFGFRMMATDEGYNKKIMNDAYFNALQMLGSQPTLADVAGFKQYLENNGITPWKLTPQQKQQLMQEQAQGGGGKKMPEPRTQDQRMIEEANIQQ